MGKLLRVIFWSLPVSSRPIDTALCQGTGWSAVTPFVGPNGVTEESIWLAWACRSLSSAHLRVGIPFVSSRALFLAALRNRPFAEPCLTAAPSPTQEAGEPCAGALAQGGQVSPQGRCPSWGRGQGPRPGVRCAGGVFWACPWGRARVPRVCLGERAGVVTQKPTGRPTWEPV